MKNLCRISMILVCFCATILTLFTSSSNAQQVVKVGAGEYVTTYLMSDRTVSVFSQATIVPLLKPYAGLDSVIDVQGAQYHVTALDEQGKVYKLSNNATYVMTTLDEFDAAFTGNFQVKGFWQANVSLRGTDSSLWYWGIADPMNYVGGATITAPKKLMMPAGRKFKKIETGANWTLGDSYILALASDNTVWKYSRGNPNPVQISIPGEAIADIATLGSNADVLRTVSNKLFAAGNLSSYVGTTGNSSTFKDVTAVWINAGVKFPIKELVGNSSTLHIIDADNNMFGSGTNVQGEVGTGVEYSPYRIAGPQGGVFGYGFNNGVLLTPPTQIQGKFKNINTSTTITFYLFAQDLGDNWYSWGRNKGFSLGNGKSLGPYAGWGGVGDYAAYPNAMDVPMPKRVNITTTVWTLQNFNPNDNIPPVVGAGINQYLSSVASTTLYGKAFQQEHAIASQIWTKVSGPSGGEITTPASLNTTITGLSNGTYVYRLSATNNKNQTSLDEVSIIVNGSATPANSIPSVNAGADQTIVLPNSATTMTGTASDTDGSIASYLWTKISGPAGGNIVSTATAATGVNALQVGVYVYSFKATDNSGGSATDSIRLTVIAAANQPPVSQAGADTTITLPSDVATLRGTGTDANGTISTYLWTKIGGPAGGNITNTASAITTTTGLLQGSYGFQLTVTDNDGAVARDTMSIVVNPAPTITLLPAVNPANTVNGLDYKYYEGSWSVLPQFAALTPVKSGSTSNFDITLANSTTQFGFSFTGYINVPADGQYTFYTSSDDGSNLYIDNVLTVLNDGLHSATEKSGQIGLKAGKHAITGLFFQATAGSVFTVSYEGQGITKQFIPSSSLYRVNQLPVAVVGAATVITLPVSSLQLNGSGTDADGTIASYQWRKVSGPAQGTIVSPTAASTVISGLVQGVYSFELSVTDNSGHTASARQQVTVQPAPIPIPTPASGKTLRVNLFNGQLPYVNSQWNNWYPQANVSSSLFKYEDGTASTISVAMPQGGNFSDNGLNYAATATMCPPEVLRIASMHTITRIFTVSGLNPAKQYSFEFFASRGYASGSKTIFSAGGVADTINTDFNTTDFAKLQNLTPASNGKIAFTLRSIGSYNYFSAFKIIEAGSGPTTAPPAITAPAVQPSKQTQGETLVELGAKSVSVYPNPFVGSFKVQLSHRATGDFVLKLSSISGKTVYYKKVSKSSATMVETIDVSNLSFGTYILEIISVTDGSKSVHKVIKN